jgi:redox-sensitive bicupin YhaK (pirin superfamily)
MTAITVDDVSTLPRLPERGATMARAVQSVTTGPQGFEGEGFPVVRAFAGVDHATLDPFVHMDQMGPVVYGPGQAKGTPWHPHRGFETVTYIIDGAFEHRDTNGGGGLIQDGDTQWMTAGRGLQHIEKPTAEAVRDGGAFHGVQLWVNLPSALKMTDPRYQLIEANAQTLVASASGESLVRIIAGSVGEFGGPGSTHTPIALVHASVTAGDHLDVPWAPDFNALVYVLGGSGRVGDEGRAVRSGQLVVFGPGETIVLEGDDNGEDQAFEVLLLGGAPIGEPVVTYGPFVMNTKAEIVQAFEDYQAGKLGIAPDED